MNIYMILLLVLIIFIINYIINNKEYIKENFGTDFFHHSFLSGVGKEQREEALQKIYDYYGLKKEEYNNVEDKKVNPNIISEYPKNELKNELQFDLEDFKYDEQKHITNDEVGDLADYLEVEKYDSGSGDLNELKKVYEDSDKKTFNEVVDLLQKRGGNVN